MIYSGFTFFPFNFYLFLNNLYFFNIYLTVPGLVAARGIFNLHSYRQHL